MERVSAFHQRDKLAGHNYSPFTIHYLPTHGSYSYPKRDSPASTDLARAIVVDESGNHGGGCTRRRYPAANASSLDPGHRISRAKPFIGRQRRRLKLREANR